ncbi:protein kinase [Lentisphaera marina]|uniref:serine/threonine-protein kinase n=1 Tax=Lentisphaera marina TaxID=1111041 RepID=UPI002366BAE9|nr:serine/threonine-protein kinase [Lentisphaera marina]MDD7986476.1 protein kinase [Lentisphaera marina]
MSDKFQVNREFLDFYDEALDPSESLLYQEVSQCEKRYKSSGDLGEGGMKKIFLVEDKLTGRKVAKATLKKTSDSQAVERFLREARINAMLEHPNIVPIHDMGIDKNGEAYFTMKVIQGKTLKKILDEIKSKSLQFDRASLLDIFVKICDAVAYAHSQEVVHMDLKPENIQVSQFGEVLVCDWGLARNLKKPDDKLISAEHVKAFVTMDGLVRGTPGYMSPEQAEGAISKSGKHSDIYSLGAILYSILTLESPGTGTVEEVLEQTKKGEIISPDKIESTVPNALQAVCNKAMSLNAEGRYACVEDLKEDILAYLHGFATSAEGLGLAGQLKLLVKRNKLSFSLISLFTSAIIVITFLFFVSLKEREEQARLSEASARKAEKEALDNLEKWEKSEELKQLIAGESLDNVLGLASDALHTYDFDKGVDLIKTALNLNENLNRAHIIMGYFQLSLFEFNEALSSFTKADLKNNHKGKIAAKVFFDKFADRTELSFDEIIWVVQHYGSIPMKQMINEHTFSPKLDFLSLEQRREYAKIVLKIQNPDLKYIHFEGDKFDCDWENLIDINALYKTGITELDLSLSKISSNVIAIKGLSLRKLVWPRSVPGTYFYYIQKCEELEELHLPQEYVEEEHLKLVPKSVKIIFY